MRKTLTVALLGIAAAMFGPVAGAHATTDSTLWRGHYTLYSECVQAGNNILLTSPRAQTYECRPYDLGGYDLYVTY